MQSYKYSTYILHAFFTICNALIIYIDQTKQLSIDDHSTRNGHFAEKTAGALRAGAPGVQYKTGDVLGLCSPGQRTGSLSWDHRPGGRSGFRYAKTGGEGMPSPYGGESSGQFAVEVFPAEMIWISPGGTPRSFIIHYSFPSGENPSEPPVGGPARCGEPGRGSDSPPDCHSLPRLRFAYPCEGRQGPCGADE